MHSATPADPPPGRRLLRLILMALLPAFALLALALLALTYYSSSRIMEQSLHGQFRQAESRLQTNLDAYLNRIYTLLSATAEHAGLADMLEGSDQAGAEAVLQAVLEKPDGEQLDILMLVHQGQPWLDLNSPYYDLARHQLQLLMAAGQDREWRLLQLDPSLSLLLHSYPLIDDDTGRVEGHLLGGMVLDDNLSLLNQLGQGLEQFSFRLLHQDRLLGPAPAGPSPAPEVLHSMLSRQRLPGQLQGYHFDTRPLRLNEQAGTLQALMMTDNQANRQLRLSYWYHGLLALILVLAAAVLLALYTLRLIATPLGRLTDFAERVGQGLPARFRTGRIEEFNFLGQSLEKMVAALHRRERELANLFNSGNSLTIMLDSHNRIQAINPAATRLFKQPAANLAGTPLAEHFSPWQLAPLENAISRVRQGHSLGGVEASLTQGGKEQRHQIWTLAPVYEQESLVAVLAQGQDITPLKQAEASLQLNDLVLKNIMEAVLIFDHRLRLVYANHAFTTISGHQIAEMLGSKPAAALQLQGSNQQLMAIWQTLRSVGYWRGEASGLRRNGASYPLWLSVTRLNTGADKPHYVAVFSDISTLKETQYQLQKMAHYDPLTGLANRSLFAELFRQAHSRAERHGASLAMMFIDLDRFKQINDSLGHQVGDEFLQMAARRLQRHSRKEDILCRFGGDEFILLITNTLSLQQARATAQRIVDAFAKPVLIRGQSLYISISIGVAFYPQHGTSMETLMQHADTALYQAKEKGRNQVQLFESGMNIRAVNLMKISGELHQALEKNQMELHYQPQFRLSDGKLIGVEALVRWNKPGAGLIYPGDFIPLAEQTGMILPLGQWILTTACRQLQRWLADGLGPLRMAINLSARQFRQPGLAQDIARLLGELKLDPRSIELEITESMLMEEMEMAVATMTSLNRLGVKLAIDDFGTGYSSLAYLKRFPIHRLKIDKSFIKDLARQAEDRAIVGSIITLAHSMKIAVIAEGIEDEYQLQQLSRQACDEGQGYLLARPMPVAEIEQLLRQDFHHPALGS